MQKNGSKEARNHGETSTFKFIQGVRVAAAFFLASPFYQIKIYEVCEVKMPLDTNF